MSTVAVIIGVPILVIAFVIGFIWGALYEQNELCHLDEPIDEWDEMEMGDDTTPLKYYGGLSTASSKQNHDIIVV